MAHDSQYTAEEERNRINAAKITEKLLRRENNTGRYSVERELGRGAMGVIHIAVDRDLNRVTAMKVITPQIIDMEKRFNAFVTEARLTAQLEHPNIVPIHHIGMNQDTGLPFYTMKLVEGEPLHEIIDKIDDEIPEYIQKYDRHMLLDIFRSVCHAVAYAHSKGVIHRDIKPENIMVGQFGEVLLMDWGLAKTLDSEAGHSADSHFYGQQSPDQDGMKTLDGTIKGSPAYIAPEQAFGDVDEVDFKTDIFLLGSTLYHMFTHCPPYEAEDIMEIISKAETCDFPPPRNRNPKCLIPLALERIILKAMAPLKENRYANAEALIEDIGAFITGRRVSGRKVFSPGQDLIRAGERTKESYVIFNGQVEVHREVNGKRITVATVGPGEIIGEMAGITETASSADVTALETTDTLVITHELMKEELQKLPPWLEHIIFSMTKRVRSLVKQVHPLLIEEGAFPVTNQLYYIFLATAQKQLTDSKNSFRLNDVVDEIAINLGLDRIGIEKILMILIEHDLAVMDKDTNVSIPNLDDLGLYVDFCRVRFEIKGGMKEISAIRLTPEKESYFRTISRKLSKLFPPKK